MKVFWAGLIISLLAVTQASAQWRHRGNNFGEAIIGGVIGGVIGGIIAPRPYYYPQQEQQYYFDDPQVSYCVSRFRSYDPRSRTYVGYDGYRHYC